MEYIEKEKVLEVIDRALAKYGGWKHLGADRLLKEVKSEIESVKAYLIYDEKSGNFRKG